MLTDKAVKAAKAKDRQYKLADHSSMYLLVKPNGAKLWQYSFTLFGKEGTFSIGEYPHVTLAEARTKQVWARSQIKEGRHPTRVQQDERDVLARAASEESANSLGAIWNEWNKKSSPSLSSPTRKQRAREVEQNIPEKFRARPINSITRRQLADLLSPIDERAPSVAKNVRQHLHSMFERAIDTGRLVRATPSRPPAY